MPIARHIWHNISPDMTIFGLGVPVGSDAYVHMLCEYYNCLTFALYACRNDDIMS